MSCPEMEQRKTFGMEGAMVARLSGQSRLIYSSAVPHLSPTDSSASKELAMPMLACDFSFKDQSKMH
eukprot:m.563466 g.563466  ORF g.563466 m.563466 type:complete len:67 (-) comp22232_c0_seq5:283-483(-)